MNRVVLGAAVVAATAVGGCAGGDRDVEAARSFDRYPLYWLGERFEQWELEQVDVDNPNLVTFVYGDCEIDDPDGALGPEGGSCTPPLQIQVQPLCAHLAVVARDPIWKRRQMRGAPVGVSDGAPVVFTERVQVKVYRGQGADAGAPLRALRALRSANAVEPVIDADDPIPAARRAVLSGVEPCTD